MKIRQKAVTDKDRQLLRSFMEYMRDGGEIGEGLRRLNEKQREAETAGTVSGRLEA